MIIILTCWMILMAFFIAICVAGGRREQAERHALVSLNPNLSEPEFIEFVPTPERSIADLSFHLKSS